MAFAAIQGLGQTVDELRAENHELKERLGRLEARLDVLESSGRGGPGTLAVAAAGVAGLGLGLLIGRRRH